MSVKLENRVAALEQEVARLQLQRRMSLPPDRQAWLDDLYGKFADDPIFVQAMKLGRKYRQSLRPRARKPKLKK
jgi:hypothetical protein